MTNRTVISLSAALLLGGLPTVLCAQDAKTSKPVAAPSAPTIPPGAPPGAMGPRPMMMDRTEMLARMLNLSEDQKEKVRPIVEEETRQMMELREKTEAKLKPILTPEQWERLHRGAPNFNPKPQVPGRTNSAPLMPQLSPKPSAPPASR